MVRMLKVIAVGLAYVLNGMFVLMLLVSEGDRSGELFFMNHGHKVYILGLKSKDAPYFMTLSIFIFVIQIAFLIWVVLREKGGRLIRDY